MYLIINVMRLYYFLLEDNIKINLNKAQKNKQLRNKRFLFAIDRELEIFSTLIGKSLQRSDCIDGQFDFNFNNTAEFVKNVYRTQEVVCT